VRAGDWKLIEFFEDGSVELYNLRDDLSERNDLSRERPEKVRELKTLLEHWRQEVGAEMPVPNPGYIE